MKRIRESIGAKIFFFTLLFFIICSVLIYGFIAWRLPLQYEGFIDKKMQKLVRDLDTQVNGKSKRVASSLVNQFAEENYVKVFICQDEILLNVAPTYYYVADYNGNQIEEVEGENLLDQYVLTLLEQLFETSIVPLLQLHDQITEQELIDSFAEKNDIYLWNDTERMSNIHYVKSTWSIDSGESFTAYLAYTNMSMDETSMVLLELVKYVLLFVILISIIIAVLYARIIASPLVLISQIAKTMSKMNLKVRWKGRRVDEIGTLGESLNELAANLDGTLQELKQNNQLLQEEFAKGKAMEQRKSDFFHMASHELKTPITVLKGYLEGMLYQIGTYKNKELYLEKSLVKIDQMEKLLKELLSVSKMNDKGMELTLEESTLVNIMEQALESQEEVIRSRNITVTYTNNSDCTIICDRILFLRAINNILNNGMIHTPKGAMLTIVVEDKENSTKLSIVNTGVHILEQDMEHIFEPFYKVDKSRNSSSKGSGLGLYIIKMILDAHGFSYKIENVEQGVEFSLYF